MSKADWFSKLSPEAQAAYCAKLKGSRPSKYCDSAKKYKTTKKESAKLDDEKAAENTSIFSKFTDREILMVVSSKMGFPVLVTGPEFETHFQYERFSNSDKEKLLSKIKDVLEHPEEVYVDESGKTTTVYSTYKTNDGYFYLVGVKLDKIKKVGFFQTIMQLHSVRNKHLKLKRLI